MTSIPLQLLPWQINSLRGLSKIKREQEREVLPLTCCSPKGNKKSTGTKQNYFYNRIKMEVKLPVHFSALSIQQSWKMIHWLTPKGCSYCCHIQERGNKKPTRFFGCLIPRHLWMSYPTLKWKLFEGMRVWKFSFYALYFVPFFSTGPNKESTI